MKKENLEIIAKATTLKPFSVEALRDSFRQNLRTFFDDKNISYRELARMMKKAGSSEEFHYTKTIRDMLEGNTPLTVEFTNEFGCVVSSVYETRLVDFLPIKKRFTQRQYLELAQQVWGEGMTNPREAKGTVIVNLYDSVIGVVT
jgi:hypothetical protein